MELIENNGLVSLYRTSNDGIFAFYDERYIGLENFTFNYAYTWNPIIVDIFEDPSSSNDGNILMLWASTGDSDSPTDNPSWQALSFSSQDGSYVGAYDNNGVFRNTDASNEYYEYTFKNSDRLGELFGEIYSGRSYKPSASRPLSEAVNLWTINQSKALSLYGDINTWDVSEITDFSELFKDKATFDSNIGNWNVSNGTNFNSMFEGATNFNQDIGSWNVSKGTDFNEMFADATSFNQDIGDWDVSNGNNFEIMFRSATLFNRDISSWDVSSGRDFAGMFLGSSSFNQDISSWDMSSNKDFGGMFAGATNFNQDISSWDVSSGEDFSVMFGEASSFNQDISSWYVDKEDNLSLMFSGASLMLENHGVSATPSIKYFNGSLLDVSNHQVGTSYNLAYIKDYDGNLHANTGSVSDATKSAYKYQGLIDVNADGTKEAIYTNKESGRWVTASINSSTGEIDYSDYGSGGTTRVVGIYIDPLVQEGIVKQFGPHDSQRRFQNDLKIDNLIAKTSGDYDGDGFQEVYWKTNDGTAYLRSLMHADGNIQYANYQNEEQMSNYLSSNGYEDIISYII